MSFSDNFDVPSRRHKLNPDFFVPLSQEFRSRVLMLFDQPYRSRNNQLIEYFWVDLHQRMKMNVGKAKLSKDWNDRAPDRDLRGFILDCTLCTDRQCLDFIEYIFKSEYYHYIIYDENTVIDNINILFNDDKLPYALTRFVWETRTDNDSGQQRKALVAYPTVIRKDDELTHSQAIEPALDLLRDKQFTAANLEFLAALQDYRNGDYGDCLTKCGSAFESTMKIICDTKGWTYPPNPSASKLLNPIMMNSQLDSNLFEQALINIATLRNKLSTAHGGGSQLRSVPAHFAKYAINATASAMLLLIDECT